ncbi:MAG: tRNA (adenosine(37)-N6)-dimethylallyltransferase MiaA [Rickettsiales bacterium]|nr:tRNA (adenosine(37)-N6)-dimethylallyltransferase MiaA [Rickettsiales bacterium]
MPKIVVISGATSSGKSQLALDLALQINAKQNCAIINADSLQIYAGLPLLSAQPSQEEQVQISHRLYGVMAPSQNSSVANWLSLVKKEVQQLIVNKTLPIIVGGTGMYISALIEGISPVPEIDFKVRKAAIDFFEKNGLEKLQQKLIHLGEKKLLDKQRLIRAYEVYLQTGKNISYFQNQPKKQILPKANFIHLNLEIDREQLYKNCNVRFEKMLEIGAIDEVKKLREEIKDQKFSPTKTLGYKEICDYLEQKITKEEMIAIATQKTRNYAKRQLTWFRHQLPNKKVCNNQQSAIKFLLNEIF